MPDALPADAIRSALSDLDGWSHADDKLNKSFEFKTFPEAISFIVRIAFEAQAMNHHPTLTNTYNTVDVTLSTHDAGGRVTQNDVDLAEKIELINWR